MRLSTMVAGLALVVAGATGCGGDESETGAVEPADAATSGSTPAEEVSEDDFCVAYTSFEDGLEATSDDDEGATYVVDHVGDLADVGLPAGAPDDAVDGLASLVTLADGLPDDPSAADVEAALDAQPPATSELQDAYRDYADEVCDDSETPAAATTEDPIDDADDPSDVTAASAGGPTVEEFCAVMAEVSDNVAGLDDDALASAMGAQLQYVATVGLPADAPLDAKLGLEVLLAAYTGLGSEPTSADLAAAYAALTPEEQAQQEALGTYTDATCPGA